ncbi:MAG: hypothetical protein JWM74_4298 [Myxococcaceae bacterium]|nr:hypothetical protein [Myxococcaceae bacterium]
MRAVGRTLGALFAFLLVLALSRTAHAHKPSDSYLTLDVHGAVLAGRWDLALRDLEYALHVDADGDGNITWAEVRGRRADIAAYAFGHLDLTADGARCTPALSSLEIALHSDGSYAVLRFEAPCAAQVLELDVAYRLLFELDPQHRGLLQLVTPAASRSHIFSTTSRTHRFDIADASQVSSFQGAVKEGIFHIWEGIDHLLFLIALLLPSVLYRESKVWKPREAFRPALVDVLKVVTAFTVAHSITLSLAALDVVRLPSRLVESAIALSVVLAALNNVFTVLEGDRWVAAFVLGLLHGFGFSQVLVDLGLTGGELLRILFGFNVGVEIGQAAVVAVFLPLAFVARRSGAYRTIVLRAGSIAIAALALVWLVERALAIKLLPS